MTSVCHKLSQDNLRRADTASSAIPTSSLRVPAHWHYRTCFSIELSRPFVLHALPFCIYVHFVYCTNFITLYQRFPIWTIQPPPPTPPNGPHEISKESRENEKKFGGPEQLLSGPLKLHCLNKIFKAESKLPSPLHSRGTEGKVISYFFPTSYVAESAFSCVPYLLSEVRNWLGVLKRDDLRLSLATMQPDIQKPASVNQA